MKRKHLTVPATAFEASAGGLTLTSGPLKYDAVPVPKSLALHHVLKAFLKCARSVGKPVGAHFWMPNPSGALILVESVGSILQEPSEHPDRDSALRTAFDEQRLVMTPLRRITTVDAVSTEWRLAVPVASGGDRAVAGLDFLTVGTIRRKRLRAVVTAFGRHLTGALALHVLRAKSDTAQRLTDVFGALAGEDDPDAIVSACLSSAIELVHADEGSLMLLDETTGCLLVAASAGLPAEFISSAGVRADEGVAGWVMTTGEPVAIEDLEGHSARSTKHGRRSAICVPIGDVEGLLGVLNIARRSPCAPLDRSDLQTLQSLARFTAIMLRRERTSDGRQDRYFGTLESLAAAFDHRDREATASSRRVWELAGQLGSAMHLPPHDLEALRVAALLHDVGMTSAAQVVGVSGRPLSTVEWGMLKMHPAAAVGILERVPALADVVPIVRHHHEHWDGSGYVAGLAGEEIPLGARILAVADAYVAMTSQRPYRDPLSSGEALAELSVKAGSQFDPAVVHVLAEQVLGEASA